MDIMVKKNQQRFRKVKEEMENWNELQSRLLSQFTNAASITGYREKFHSVVLSLDKMVRDDRQLIKEVSIQKNVKQLQQHVGIKPSTADCLDGLQLLYDMHESEYRLKLSFLSAISAVALKPSATDDLGALQQLSIDQPNIPKEEVQFIFDIIFAEEMA